jgi:hypothetical protein
MTFKEKLAKLIDVKSIVTIALTLIFCFLAVVGRLEAEFMTTYSTIIAFYFGTQVERKSQQSTKGEQ